MITLVLTVIEWIIIAVVTVYLIWWGRRLQTLKMRRLYQICLVLLVCILLARSIERFIRFAGQPHFISVFYFSIATHLIGLGVMVFLLPYLSRRQDEIFLAEERGGG